MTDLISRADAESDDLIIKGAKGIQDGLYNIKDGKLFKYKANGGTVRTYPIVPSADAVDCTDFIEWLVDRVLDETIWEYNSVAYGEIICRKLEKLGILEATEEPSYYIRPSADAVPQLRQTDTLIIADALRYLAKDTERHLVDRTRADALRQQFLKYGASMCKGGDDE